MRLLEDNKPEPNGHSVNGNGVHTNGQCEDTDSESEVEEAEPVSATLVLRVVSEPASPSVSRKSSFRRSDQPPTFLTEESRGEQFLQVQVQRSTSSGSINGSRPQSRSRPGSAAPSLYITDTEPPGPGPFAVERFRKQSGLSSRESSMSPTPSMYGLIEAGHSGELSSTEFMARISDETRAIQAGVRSLRAEMDSQLRLLDIGQEAVVLSGLSKHASSSLKNIKNLYDETKYLKTYLEKLEAKVHYDMSVRHTRRQSPPWWRRILFLGAVLGTGAWLWRRTDQASFNRSLEELGSGAGVASTKMLEFFTSDKDVHSKLVTIR